MIWQIFFPRATKRRKHFDATHFTHKFTEGYLITNFEYVKYLSKRNYVIAQIYNNQLYNFAILREYFHVHC